MKYEIYAKSGKNAKCKLIVKRHGKTFIEKVKIKDAIDDDYYKTKFEKRINKALGKKAYDKFIKMLEKDFDC